MKRLLACVTFAALACTLAGTASAQQGRGQRHLDAHTKMRHPSQLGDGHHHFHTTYTGHKVHAHVRGGRVVGLYVLDRFGRSVQVFFKYDHRRYLGYGFYDPWGQREVWIWFALGWY